MIIGAGGFGRELLDIVEVIGSAEHRFIGFLDDGVRDQDLVSARSAVVLGPVATLAEIDAEYLIGISNPGVRRQIDNFARSLGRIAPVVIHPAATIGSLVRLGPGTVVCAHASLTSNITVGRHCQINPQSTIGHDAVLEDFVTILPGCNISGNVYLEAGSTMGTNSSVIQGRRIGARATIGAGAVVVRDIPPGVTAAGVPARIRSDSQSELDATHWSVGRSIF